MIARMVFQMTMMVVVIALAVHMVVQKNNVQTSQVAAVKVEQATPKVISVAAVQPKPVAVAAVVVAQVKPAKAVAAKEELPTAKSAMQSAPGTMEVANLPGSGDVVR